MCIACSLSLYCGQSLLPRSCSALSASLSGVNLEVGDPQHLAVEKSSKTVEKAKKIAFAIANSPLVKTAVAGEDANWGRILMGLGKSGEKIDQKKLIIKIGDFIVAEKGKISPSYNEEKLQEYMTSNSIYIEIDLKQGKEEFECYTCDFTHDYIDINAHYRRS